MGGTLSGVSSKSKARLDLSGPDALILHCGKTELRINYSKINTLEYGQNVSRRYAAAILISPLLLLSKSRKHFVTLGYVDAKATSRRWSCASRRATSARARRPGGAHRPPRRVSG